MDPNNSQQINLSTRQEAANTHTDQEIIPIASDMPPDPIPFLYITPTRLVVMSLLSLSIYLCYWFYKNWQAIKYSKNTRIMPLWRAIFSIFFVYSLFREIAYFTKKARSNKPLPYKMLAAIYIISFIVVSLKIFPPIVVISLPLCLVPFQKAINFFGMQAHCKPRKEFSLGEVLALTAGLTIIFFSLLYDVHTGRITL